MVEKNNGDSKPFEFSKLARGLRLASPHYSDMEIYKIARDIAAIVEKRAYSKDHARQGKTIRSEEIGRIVLDKLREKKMPTMWIRFALLFFDIDKNHDDMSAVLAKLKSEWTEVR